MGGEKLRFGYFRKKINKYKFKGYLGDREDKLEGMFCRYREDCKDLNQQKP